MDKERQEIVESLFNTCALGGQVDCFVLSQVRAASSPKLFDKLILSHCSRLKDPADIKAIEKTTPRRWRKNVIE
jgi:hypothetical protein